MKRVQRELYAYLLDWLSQHALRADTRVSPGIAALVASWAIFGVGVEYGRAGDPAAAVARSDEVLEVVLGGLAAACGARSPSQARRLDLDEPPNGVTATPRLRERPRRR